MNDLREDWNTLYRMLQRELRARTHELNNCHDSNALADIDASIIEINAAIEAATRIKDAAKVEVQKVEQAALIEVPERRQYA